MNRRELLQSAAVAAMPGLRAEEMSMHVDKRQSDGPLVVFWTEQRLQPVQASIIQRQMANQAAVVGARVLFAHSITGCAVPSASNAKYHASESLGNYSYSVSCQTLEELKELKREWLSPGSGVPS